MVVIHGSGRQEDGARIIGFGTPVMKYANVVLKGKPVQYELDKLQLYDIKELRKIGALNFGL